MAEKGTSDWESFEMKEKIIQDGPAFSDTSDTEPIIQKPAQNDEIPDGGLIGWYQVLGSFFLFFNTW